MPSRSLRRRTLVLLLTATLAASWTAAAGLGARPVPKAAAPVHQNLLSRARSFLLSLWGEEGCHIDPNGLCITGAVQPTPLRIDTDSGCHIDPDGLCAH